MTERKSFVLYNNYANYFGMLSDEEKGRLIWAIFEYQASGEVIGGLSAAGEMAFAFIKDQLDRDREKYEEKCEKNRINGAKGGRPKDNGSTEKTERFSEKPKKPDTDTDTDTDNVTVTDTDTDNDNDNDARSAGVAVGKEEAGGGVTARDFEAFWREYPKHFCYDEAKTAYYENIHSKGEADEAIELLRRWKNCHEWTKDDGRWIRRADRFLCEIFPTRDSPPEPKIGGSFDVDDFFEAALRRSYADDQEGTV